MNPLTTHRSPAVERLRVVDGVLQVPAHPHSGRSASNIHTAAASCLLALLFRCCRHSWPPLLFVAVTNAAPQRNRPGDDAL